MTVPTRARHAAIPDASLDRRRQNDPLGVTLGEVLPRGALQLEAMFHGEPPGERRGRTNVRVTVRVVPDGTGWTRGDAYEIRAVAIDVAGDVRAAQHGRFVAPSANPSVPRGGHLTRSDLGPVRCQCRVAVHDTRTSRVGSLFLDVVADRH